MGESSRCVADPNCEIELTLLQHSWNEKTSQYETVESSPPGEVEGLEEYVFVARARIGKYTGMVKSLISETHKTEFLGSGILYRRQIRKTARHP